MATCLLPSWRTIKIFHFPLYCVCLLNCKTIGLGWRQGTEYQLGKSKIFIKEPNSLFKLDDLRNKRILEQIAKMQAAFRGHKQEIWWKKHKAVRGVQTAFRAQKQRTWYKEYCGVRCLSSDGVHLRFWWNSATREMNCYIATVVLWSRNAGACMWHHATGEVSHPQRHYTRACHAVWTPVW